MSWMLVLVMSSVSLYQLIARVTEDHLPDLIAEFLPLADEVAGFASGENGGAMLLEQSNDGEGISLFGAELSRGNGLKSERDAIKLRFDLEDDLLGPLDLIGSSGKFIHHTPRRIYGGGKAGFGYGGLLCNVRTSQA